jgi:CubicO group peptidase (beta-lactamase class C family)
MQQNSRSVWLVSLGALALAAVAQAELPSAARPGAVGMSAERLARLDAALEGYVERGEIAGAVTLVARHGRVVFHEANGFRDVEAEASMQPNSLFRIASQTKAIVSVAAMILQEEGKLLIGDPVGEYLPEFMETTVAEPDGAGGYTIVPARRPITIRDLLTMRSGLRSTSFENYGLWVTSDDWVRHALTRPLESEPGTSTSYSTGDSHLLSAVLTEALDRDLLTFANEHLFDPLDSQIRSWQRDPKGYRFGGNNMSLTPRALLRFGQLDLNDGRHEGEQLLPAEWIERSTEPRVNDSFRGYWYGYYWWIDRVDGTRVQFAWGHGGQYLFVVPAYELTVVITSDLQSDPPENYNDRLRELVIEKLVGSLDGAPGGFGGSAVGKRVGIGDRVVKNVTTVRNVPGQRPTPFQRVIPALVLQ